MMSGLLLYGLLVSVDLLVTYILVRMRYRQGVIDGVNAYRDYLIAGLPRSYEHDMRARCALELRLRAIIVRAEVLGVKEGERAP